MSTLRTKTIDLVPQGIPLFVTLRRATMGDDMRRAMLAANAMQNPLADAAEQTVAVVIYPRCMACTVSGTVDGKDAEKMTAADFIALPYEIGEAWLTAALELNPGWRLSPFTEEEEDAAQKNV